MEDHWIFFEHTKKMPPQLGSGEMNHETGWTWTKQPEILAEGEGKGLLTVPLAACKDYRMASHQNISGALIKKEPVLWQVFLCSRGTAGMWHTTPAWKQVPSPIMWRLCPAVSSRVSWWKLESNVTLADRFIKTQKILQRPFWHNL